MHKFNNNRLFVVPVFILGFILLLSNALIGQQKRIPDEVKYQIDNYKANAFKNRNNGNDNAAAMYMNKIGFIYWEYFIYDEAVKNFQEVLKINQDEGNANGEKKVLDNLAFVYTDMERYDLAIKCFSQSHTFYVASNNQRELSYSYSNLAISYNYNGQAKEAIDYAENGLSISLAINDVKLMRSFYGILHEAYDKLGNKEKSVEYFSLYTSIDKHIQQALFQEREKKNEVAMGKIQNEKEEAIEGKRLKELELRYAQDTLKQRQLSIELLNAENEAKAEKVKAQEARIKAERRLIYFLIVVFILLAVFAFFVFKQMQEKKRANKKLEDLNREIEKKNRQILDSINYASHIQESILPYRKSISEQIGKSFVLYKPKDIVSGDFYWYSKKDDKIFIAAIDCTGHGVPGAFMSMIGNTLINEVVNERNISKPSEVLTLLNEKVVSTLNQDNNKGQEGFSEDGMDLTFCMYDKKNNKLELALANHTACIFKNGEMQTIEGDIFSIGGNVGDFKVEYTNHVVDIDTDTSVYMFSDGYQDQFGGPKNQKYMGGRFYDLLKSLQSESFDKHEELIDREFNEWRGDYKQVDDILVIGLSLNKH